MNKDSTIKPETKSVKPKTPLSFFTGALTSFGMAFISFLLSRKLVIYFTLHSLVYKSQFTQSIASGFKTLVIGISFLSTFTFSFIGMGLTVVFIRSLFTANESNHA